MSFPFSTSNLPRQLFLNNEYVDPQNATKLKNFNPRDGTLVADDVPNAGEEDVELAVSYAEAAFPAWKKLPPKDRRNMLLKFADLVEEHAEVLGKLTRLTLGSTVAFNDFEAAQAAEGLRYYVGWMVKFAGETYPQDDGFLKIVRNEPLGVTAGIVPWNGPLITLGLKAAPALVTGNCFIFKPSEKTPFATIALGFLAKQAGLPPGVFQVLPGDGSTGELLARHMRVRKVSFTGSVATGKRVQQLAAESNLKRVTLELGGKSPAVIFDDCDVENAVKWAVDGITNMSGQVCIASSRLFVQDGIYDAFLKEYLIAMRARANKVDDQAAAGTDTCPLVDEAQFRRVSGFVERARASGIQKLTGGPRDDLKGYFIDPVVFENPPLDSEIYTKEIFGPVAVVRRFKTEEEVLKLSNDSEYGLMAGVFTQDINKAMRVAAEFESGMVGINCISLNFLSVPFGGTKQSGLGRECGISALRAFTEQKTVMVNLTY